MPTRIIAHPVRQPAVCINAYRQKERLGCRRIARFSVSAGITRYSRLAVVVMVLGLVLTGCITTSVPHIGKTARPDNRVPLTALPPGETTWSAKDLDLHYMAELAGENLEVSGFVEFKSNLGKYPVINAFRLYLHYLDTDGVVLDSNLLLAVGRNTEYRFVRWSFKQQWPVSPGAVAIGFSYRGGASEAGGKGKFGQSHTGWEVYQYP